MSRLRRTRVLTGQTANAVAGTRETIVHGLTDYHGNALAPTSVFAQPLIADADGALVLATIPVVAVVSYDATNVVVRANVAAQGFDLILIYEVANEDYPA